MFFLPANALSSVPAFVWSVTIIWANFLTSGLVAFVEANLPNSTSSIPAVAASFMKSSSVPPVTDFAVLLIVFATVLAALPTELAALPIVLPERFVFDIFAFELLALGLQLIAKNATPKHVNLIAHFVMIFGPPKEIFRLN
jgi:hypothetical protein